MTVMYSNPQERIVELWDQAYQTDKRTEKTALLEEIIRIADIHQFTITGIEARSDLIAACEDRKSLVALAWILAKLDQNPSFWEELDEQMVHWLFFRYYLCIVNVAVNYPEVSKQKAWELTEDFLHRIREHGYQHEVMGHRIRMFLHSDFGEIEAAKKAYYAWEKALNTQLKDPYIDESDEWDLYTKARSQRDIFDDLDKALEIGKLILDGHVTGEHIEVHLPSMMVIDLWEAKRFQEAERFQQRTERQVIEHAFYLEASWHLGYMVLTNQLDRAMTFFQQHVIKGFSAWEIEIYNPNFQYDFLLHVRLLFQRLQHDGQQTFTLRSPLDFPIQPIQADQYSVEQMVDWLNEQLTDLATRFDHRNENQMYMDEVHKYERWIFDK